MWQTGRRSGWRTGSCDLLVEWLLGGRPVIITGPRLGILAQLGEIRLRDVLQIGHRLPHPLDLLRVKGMPEVDLEGRLRRVGGECLKAVSISLRACR